MRRRILYLTLLLALLLLPLGGLVPAAGAQDYYFSMDRLVADLWIDADGTVRMEYWVTFTGDPGAHPIDVVDVGMPPRAKYDIAAITGDVDGRPIDHIGTDYQGSGQGVSVWLDGATIAPGRTGTLHLVFPSIGGLIYEADDRDYAGLEFSPFYFQSNVVHGTTDMAVRFHLPPGVQPEEPRWLNSPAGWPQEQPDTYHDRDERIVYEWLNPAARPDKEYKFGAYFPRRYVAASAVQKQPSPLLGILSALGAFLCNPVVIVIAFIVLAIVFSARANARRRMQYLPPSMQVEGVGIKRGLTAVEAAIVLETPLNKVLTMALFGLLKKGALVVLDDNPLKVQVAEPRPEGLQPYEGAFLDAVKADGTLSEPKLRAMVVDLVKGVNSKMKGFSRKETVAYYRDIVRRAWEQVDKAETPEVRGRVFGDGLEWTMLDSDFGKRTEDTFRQGPILLPTWWGGYRPWVHGAPAAGPAPSGGSPMPSGPIQLPTLPGADFAAKIVRGIEGTAGRIVRSVTDFTGGVTQTTNPPPKTSSGSGRSGGWSGGGGHSCACACACACAGCACACAGGGR